MRNSLTIGQAESLCLDAWATKSKAVHIDKLITLELVSGEWPGGVEVTILLSDEQAITMRELLNYAITATIDARWDFDNQPGQKYRIESCNKFAPPRASQQNGVEQPAASRAKESR